MGKGTLLGTPNREPQEYHRNIMEYKDPGRYIPIKFLLYSWGSLFGVPNKVPLLRGLGWGQGILRLGFRLQGLGVGSRISDLGLRV